MNDHRVRHTSEVHRGRQPSPIPGTGKISHLANAHIRQMPDAPWAPPSYTAGAELANFDHAPGVRLRLYAPKRPDERFPGS